MNLEQRLRQGLRAMGFSLASPVPQQLLRFLALLERWNRVYNLTAVRDPEEMVSRHLFDSLAVLPYVQGPRILDIGTGAGLPGIPLALALPHFEFTLLDSNHKKIRFVTQAVHELGLRNVTIVRARVEEFHPEKKFATLIARALASIPDMLARCRHLADRDSIILAMKGTFPQAELAALDESYSVKEVKTLQVPGLGAARHLAVITLRG